MLTRISIIIPVFNEQNTICEILEKVLLQKQLEKEIIVIDDNSTDETKKLLKDNFSEHIILIENEKNYGKGYCIKKGIKKASGEIIIIQDADLEYDPSDYNSLLNPIIKNKADVVYGSRFIGDSEKRVLFFWHRIGNLFLTLLSNAFTNLNLTDMEVGYKAFRTKTIKDIKLLENRFGFEPEITAKISKKKLRIFEVGIKYYGRTYEEGKKINWKDGIAAIYCIFKYNLFS